MALLQGRVDKQYISSIEFMDQREILDQVLDTTGESATLVDIMELTGRMVQTNQPTYTHFTNDYVSRSGVIAAIDATNNGDKPATTNETLVVTLTADEELPIVGDQALLANKKKGYVSAVSTSTKVVTISPYSDADADTLNAGGSEITTTQRVTFFSGAYGEGSGDPTSRKPAFKRSENQIQIFKTAREITDLQKVSTIEVKFNGKNFIMYKMQNDALLEHKAKISNQFLVGKKASYNDGDGNKVYLTQGLREYILGGDGTVLTQGGVDIPLSTTIDKDDLRSMSRGLDKRGAGNEYFLFAGGDLDADLDDVVLALPGVDDGVIYNSWGIGDGKKKALDLGVNSFRIYGRTFHKKKIGAYDHPELFAPSAAFNYGSEGYLVPAGKMPVDGSGNRIDALRCRFMSNDGTDFGRYQEVLTGKLAPIPTNTTSVLHISYQSIMGLEACGIRQFGIFSK